MSKIAVIGSSGYIGSYLTQSLKNKHKILSHSRNKINGRIYNKNIFKKITGDIKNYKTIKKIINQKPNVIIYTISLNHIDSEENISKSIENNFLPLVNLVKEIIKKNMKVKIIYLSTMQVYGREYTKKIINEDYQKNIQNIYALTHSMCEDLLSSYSHILDFHCLRISNVYGMPTLKKINCWWLVINDFCRNAVMNNKIIINSDGSALRDFIHLSTIYEVVSALIKKKESLPFINVCSGKTFSIKQIAFKIANNSFFKGKVDVIIKKKSKKNKKKFYYNTSNLKKLSVNSSSKFDTKITQFLECLTKN